MAKVRILKGNAPRRMQGLVLHNVSLRSAMVKKSSLSNCFQATACLSDLRVMIQHLRAISSVPGALVGAEQVNISYIQREGSPVRSDVDHFSGEATVLVCSSTVFRGLHEQNSCVRVMWYCSASISACAKIP